MTVQSTQSTVSYTPSGIENEQFTVPFRYDLESDIKVVVIDAAGAQTQQVLNSAYTITVPGDSGVVTWIGTSPDNTNTVTLTRFVDLTQLTDFQSNGPLPAEDIEDALDKLTFETQQLSERTGGPGFIPGQKLLTTDPLDLSQWDAESMPIANVADPTDDQDAATKAFVNGQIAGQGNVAPPGDPADDLKVLQAFGGTFDWKPAGVPTPSAQDLVLTSTGPNLGDVAFLAPPAPNYLINSSMDVAQRGILFQPAGAGAQYTLDRWIANYDSGGDVSRVTSATPGIVHAIFFQNFAQKWGLCQWIEFTTTRQLLTGPVSLSFAVKGVSTHNIRVAILEFDGTADEPPLDPVLNWLGTGVDPDFKAGVTVASVTDAVVPSPIGSIIKVENVTLSPITTNIGVFIFNRDFGAPLIEFSQVQLVSGSKVYPFEFRTFEDELQACKRYFAKTFPHETTPAGSAGFDGALLGIPQTGDVIVAQWRYEVEMRQSITAGATFVSYNPNGGNGDWRNGADNDDAAVGAPERDAETSVVLSATSAGVGNQYFIHASVDAELGV